MAILASKIVWRVEGGMGVAGRLLSFQPIGGLLLAVVGAIPSVIAFADEEKTNAAAPRTPVMVEGTVTYTGPPLKPIPVPETGAARHLIEVHAKSNGLKDAVAWLEGVPARGRPANGGETRPVQMDQQNYFFLPHVLAIEAGQEVEFFNNDAANHGVTAASLEPKNSFNVTTPPGRSYKHRFVAAKRPVAIGCPIHGAMAAWVFVFEDPYHAVTDENGLFRLPPVPPGRYMLHVRHQDGGMSKQEEVLVHPGEPLRIRISFGKGDIKVGGSKNP
jgi:plastocyanin